MQYNDMSKEGKKDKEQLPSNDDGKSKSYFNIKVKDYQTISDKKNKKIYY